ncbi:MAG: hypothetical protein GKR93_16980 [Gammaproteobacteria bacterium]|nr:hypothetical protein [Gammaproteobacteria bacterium]
MRLLTKVEQQLNKLIRLDQDAVKRLSAISGQIILLELLNTEFIVYLVPSGSGIRLLSESREKPGVSIRATPGDMIAYLLHSRQSSGSLEIVGDVGLAQTFQSIMQDIEMDWEEQLAVWFGDSLAHQMGRMFRGGFDLLQDTHHKFQQDISEYLRFEKNLSLEKSEMAEFINDVDILRNDVERLKLRVERLRKSEKLN